MKRLFERISGDAAGAAIAATFVLAAAVAGTAVMQSVDLQQARNRGQALFEEKQTARAAEVFGEVTAKADATAADWLNLALARYELAGAQEADEAILAALASAQELRPDHAAAFYLRGLVRARRGDNASAAVEFTRAADLDPTDPAILYNLSATLHDLGRVDEALEGYDRVAAMGFDVAQQFYSSSVYRAGQALAVRDGRDAAMPYLDLWRAVQGRLSQAQRAPTALEAGRHKRVTIPRANYVAPVARTAEDIELRFRPLAVPESLPLDNVAIDDFGAGAALVFAAADAAVEPQAGLAPLSLPAGPLAIGDYDRDGLADVVAFGTDATVVLHARAATDDTIAFEPADVEGIPVVPLARHAIWVDADHDGDLDIMIASADPGRGFRWIANHGGGKFVEMTESAGLGGPPQLESPGRISTMIAMSTSRSCGRMEPVRYTATRARVASLRLPPRWAPRHRLAAPR